MLFGIPTWYYGEAQADWDDFFPTLEEIDFTDKLVGIFGCGDQEDYADYFCDAIGTVRDIIEPHGAIVVGNWPTEGYNFELRKPYWKMALSSDYVLMKIANQSLPQSV